MAYKVAVAGMVEGKQGPWIRATGREVGVRISHLSPGENIRMHSKQGDMMIFDKPGKFPGWIVGPGDLYMFEKFLDAGQAGSTPTVVEVEFK